jgi:Family of unknown function (DUF6459)
MPTQQALLSHAEFTTEVAPCSDSVGRSESAGRGLSALRLVPVPDTGPPFDGDLPAGATTMVDWPSDTDWDGLGQGAPAHRAVARTALTPGSQAADTAEDGWPERFALVLTEALAGARPLRQLFPLMTDRARAHLDTLMPLFGGGQRPRVQRVLMNRPTRDAIEMTVVVGIGARTRALAVRLERATAPQRATRPQLTGQAPRRWLCTAVEAA